MIDHALGRPDARYRKYQIFSVVLVWALYLWRGHHHGPKPFRPLSRFLGRHLTVWHVVVITGLHYYLMRNLSTIVGLQFPQPLANMYSLDYFRATWITTALDAGFWTAMSFKPKWLRDISSVIFSVYFLIAADQADETVRRVRGGLTKEHLRVSWNKPNSPYLAFLNRLCRPRHLTMAYKPRPFTIERPKASSYSERIHAWLYFDGPTSQLKNHDKIILDIPGGGFVAMDPRCHDDKLMGWATKTGLPIVALDYRKAPEYPYPYALNECYDAYYQIMVTKGRIIGLSGEAVPKIVLSGDSAGGNLATALMLMLLESSPHSSYFPNERTLQQRLPMPVAAILIYPALDVNITSWMNDEQIALMRLRKRRHINEGVIQQKRDQYRSLTNSPYASDDEDEDEDGVAAASTKREKGPSNRSQNPSTTPIAESPTAIRLSAAASTLNASQPTQPSIKTRLYMRSMIAFFNDRVISPEMLRGMIMMYVGEHNRPDFETDYLLSPVRAPEQLLAQFPKVHLLTGERDPLIDDTVLFAARLRQAKLQLFHERKELGLIPDSQPFVDSDHVDSMLVPKVSHGFLQFAGVYRAGWDYIEQCSRWMKEAFRAADERDLLSARSPASETGEDYFVFGGGGSGSGSGSLETAERKSGPQPLLSRHRRRSSLHSTGAGESSDGDDRPLEMTSAAALRMTPLTAGSTAKKSGSTTSTASTTAAAAERKKASSGRGSVRKPAAFSSGRKSPVATRHGKGPARLSSMDDLMGRRMNELAEGLKVGGGGGGGGSSSSSSAANTTITSTSTGDGLNSVPQDKPS